jgi:hypothetical protein
VDAINKSLTEAERLNRLRLIRSDNVGPRTLQFPIAAFRQRAGGTGAAA